MTAAEHAHLAEVVHDLIEYARDHDEDVEMVAVMGQLPGVYLASLTTIPELIEIVARGVPH